MIKSNIRGVELSDRILSTRKALESALDSGRLFAAMANGNWWKMRRSGRTQLWKRTPARFRIPFKVGLKLSGELTEQDLPLNLNHYRIRKD